ERVAQDRDDQAVFRTIRRRLARQNAVQREHLEVKPAHRDYNRALELVGKGSKSAHGMTTSKGSRWRPASIGGLLPNGGTYPAPTSRSARRSLGSCRSSNQRSTSSVTTGAPWR